MLDGRLALRCVVMLIAAASWMPTHASEALAKKNECLACHAAASKLVGPAYREVASKYAGQPDAEDQLVQSIRQGSSGKWGDIAMPPHPKLPEADARKLAKWILAGAK